MKKLRCSHASVVVDTDYDLDELLSAVAENDEFTITGECNDCKRPIARTYKPRKTVLDQDMIEALK